MSIAKAAAALIEAKDRGTYRAELDAFAALRAALALPAPEVRELAAKVAWLAGQQNAPYDKDLQAAANLLLALYVEPPAPPAPIPMLLWCPICRTQHVDTPQREKGWTNPPHRSHECQACGHVWRVADVATTGVLAIQTKGERDGTAEPPAPREPRDEPPVPRRPWPQTERGTRAEMEEDAAKLRAEVARIAPLYAAAPSEIARDAARYRWLCAWSKQENITTQEAMAWTALNTMPCLPKSKIDAAIDAAIEQEEK